MGGVPVKRKKRAEAADGPRTFRSPTAVVFWWVWLVFAAANLVDLAVQGRDHTSVVVAAVLVLATGVAYVVALRPRVIADDAGLTVQNPLRDYRIGWAGVAKVDLIEVLRVYCEWDQAGSGPGSRRSKVIRAWAVHYSRRRQLRDQARTHRASLRPGTRRTFGFASYGGSDPHGSGGGRRGGYAGTPDSLPASAAEAEAEKVVSTLSEYATRAAAETVGTTDGAAATAGAATTDGAGTADRATATDGAVGGTAGQAAADRPEAAESPEHPRNPGWLEPLTSTWSRPAIAALFIPALILLVVYLV